MEVVKQPRTLNLQNYVNTGNLAVDMCCACIIHERKFSMPIKAIAMNKTYFSLFQKWVEKEYGEEAVYKEFYIDMVEIRCEKIMTGERLSIEYYPIEKE